MSDGDGKEVDQGERVACPGVGLVAVDHNGGKSSLSGEVKGSTVLGFLADGVAVMAAKVRMGLLTMSSTSK